MVEGMLPNADRFEMRGTFPERGPDGTLASALLFASLHAFGPNGAPGTPAGCIARGVARDSEFSEALLIMTDEGELMGDVVVPVGTASSSLSGLSSSYINSLISSHVSVLEEGGNDTMMEILDAGLKVDRSGSKVLGNTRGVDGEGTTG